MRTLFLTLALLAMAMPAAAQPLGTHAAPKPPVAVPQNVPDPLRQGGNTISSATPIPYLPYNDTGTTLTYTDDYDEICPYSNSFSPDVVYRYVADSGVYALDIDLCGSDYDTKLYVYDSSLSLIACNDDFYFGAPCGMYVSKLENVPVGNGGTYYIVVDGYGGDAGNYVIEVWMTIICCTISCPPSGFPEDEPPLVPEYIDEWNGGCNTPGFPFQELSGDASGERILCGVAGWYTSGGSDYRDTDWYLLTMGAGNIIEITADAEWPTYMFELGPQDCDAVQVVQSATFGPCAEAFLVITGYGMGQVVWFWVGPTTFTPPGGWDCTYNYVVWITGLAPGPITTEMTTWSTIKALYD